MFARYSRSGLALMGVPLYAGPLLAGWSAAPWPVPAAMAALFFLMQLARGIEIGRGGVAPLLVLAAVQIAVVGAVYGLGRLLAPGTGTLALPVWLPLSLTLFGTAVGVLRYRRTPRDDQMLDFLDQAIEAIERGTPPDFAVGDGDAEPLRDTEAETAAQAALEALWGLPDGAGIAAVDPIVQRLEAQADHRAFVHLLAQVDDGSHAVDLAMLRYLASARIRSELAGAPDLGFALSLLLNSDDPVILAELAALIATLLDENAPASALPDHRTMARRGRQFPVLAPLAAQVEEAHRKWRTAFG